MTCTVIYSAKKTENSTEPNSQVCVVESQVTFFIFSFRTTTWMLFKWHEHKSFGDFTENKLIFMEFWFFYLPYLHEQCMLFCWNAVNKIIHTTVDVSRNWTTWNNNAKNTTWNDYIWNCFLGTLLLHKLFFLSFFLILRKTILMF